MGARAAGREGAAPSARGVAAVVLERVARDGAYAAAALEAELERAVQLDARDRRLASELAYGALRCSRWLEQRLGAHAPRGLGKLDPATRAHLLVAAYQLLLLDRVPARAAVSSAVDLVRAERGERLASFANALLRKLAADAERHPKAPFEQALVESAPPGLLARLARSLGSEEDARAMLVAGPWPPPTCIRLAAGQQRDAWRERLRLAAPGAEVVDGRVSALCIGLRGAGRLAALPGCESAWWIQEEGAQAVALALGARPSERVLDACAGRGNKTAILAERVGPRGSVDAADRHESKLAALGAQASRDRWRLGRAFAVDWSVGAGEVPQGYDRVLVDAPCSGLGTLRRRPEIASRDLGRALEQLPALQTEILARAASRCRPGGRVVYAVCSVLREEAEQVVERACARVPGLQPAPFDAPELEPVAAGRTAFRLLPHVHGTDGFFVASLVRAG